MIHTHTTHRTQVATGAQGSPQPGFNQVIPLHQRAPWCDVSLSSLTSWRGKPLHQGSSRSAHAVQRYKQYTCNTPQPACCLLHCRGTDHRLTHSHTHAHTHTHTHTAASGNSTSGSAYPLAWGYGDSGFLRAEQMADKIACWLLTGEHCPPRTSREWRLSNSLYRSRTHTDARER